MLADMKDAHYPTVVIEQMPDGTYLIMTTSSNDAIAATTVPAMTEALTLNMLRGANLGSPVNVVWRGISPGKAEAIIAHVDDNIRRLPRNSAKAILISGENSDLGVAHLKLANYKIARNGIKIDPNVFRRVLTKGPYKGSTELTVNLRISPTVTGQRPLLLCIFLIGKEFTQEVIAAIKAKLARIIASASTEVSPADLILAIKYGLKEDFR